MSEQTTPASRPNPVHYWLYQRFYSNGAAVVEAAVSSHWRECTQRFEVRPIGEDHFELAGMASGRVSTLGGREPRGTGREAPLFVVHVRIWRGIK